MLNTETKLFLCIPTESPERVLRPAKIVSIENDMFAVEPEEPELALEAGQEILIYYEIKQTFMQQPARIDALLDTEHNPTVGLVTTGEPVSAESRQCYRVSTVMSDLVAGIESQDCPLLDVSISVSVP